MVQAEPRRPKGQRSSMAPPSRPTSAFDRRTKHEQVKASEYTAPPVFRDPAHEQAHNKAPPKQANWEIPYDVLQSDLQECRVDKNKLQEELRMSRGETGRLQKELHKLVEMENLAKGGKGSNAHATNEARKGIEKQHIVRLLKLEIATLRGEAQERDIADRKLRKSLKATEVQIVTREREEYYLESLRMRQVSEDLQFELIKEKQVCLVLSYVLWHPYIPLHTDLPDQT